MILKKIKTTLRDWSFEISEKYGEVLISEYQEPINTDDEKIFLTDILIKKQVELDDYGFALYVRILRVKAPALFYELTISTMRGDGKILEEKTYTFSKEKELNKEEVSLDIYKTLSAYKEVITRLIDSVVSQ